MNLTSNNAGFSCPSCSHYITLSVADLLSGKETVCNCCQTVFKIDNDTSSEVVQAIHRLQKSEARLLQRSQFAR